MTSSNSSSETDRCPVCDTNLTRYRGPVGQATPAYFGTCSPECARAKHVADALERLASSIYNALTTTG